MRKILKKLVSATLVAGVMVSSMFVNVSTVDAAYFANKKDDKNKTFEKEDKYTISYDSSKYKVYWMDRKTIVSKCQYRSMWTKLDKDDTLGTTTIRAYYLEPKSKTGGSFYALAGCQVSMDPTDVKGDVTGMSQLAHFGINTTNPDSRVCSPTVDLLKTQVSNTENKSISINGGAGLTYKKSDKSWEATGKLDIGTAWGASSSYTYDSTNMILTQKNKNSDYASWNYDYKSKKKDVTWNAYLMSSSTVTGQVVYRLNSKPSDKNRGDNIPIAINYDIRYGAGNSSNGKVANRMGASTNRDMSIETGTILLDY